jgi:hypothetical protein
MQYRKKPVVIEAVQFTGHNITEISFFTGLILTPELESETAYLAGQGAPIFSIIIPTLEGDHKAITGDWIIKGVKGEFYPCKPDIFALTYEPVDIPATA